jgi:hypothetical protein
MTLKFVGKRLSVAVAYKFSREMLVEVRSRYTRVRLMYGKYLENYKCLTP